MNNEKTHGWILWSKDTGRYVTFSEYTESLGGCGFSSIKTTSVLQEAYVTKTRAHARNWKRSNERVLKVALSCRGKTVAVIGRG